MLCKSDYGVSQTHLCGQTMPEALTACSILGNPMPCDALKGYELSAFLLAPLRSMLRISCLGKQRNPFEEMDSRAHFDEVNH